MTWVCLLGQSHHVEYMHLKKLVSVCSRRLHVVGMDHDLVFPGGRPLVLVQVRMLVVFTHWQTNAYTWTLTGFDHVTNELTRLTLRRRNWSSPTGRDHWANTYKHLYWPALCVMDLGHSSRHLLLPRLRWPRHVFCCQHASPLSLLVCDLCSFCTIDVGHRITPIWAHSWRCSVNLHVVSGVHQSFLSAWWLPLWGSPKWNCKSHGATFLSVLLLDRRWE